MTPACVHARVWRYLKPPVSLAASVSQPDAAPPKHSPIVIEATRCLDCSALDRHDGRGWEGGRA